jgi:hypothetical protein
LERLQSPAELRYSGEFDIASSPGEGISSKSLAIKQHQSDNVNGGLEFLALLGRDKGTLLWEHTASVTS